MTTKWQHVTCDDGKMDVFVAEPSNPNGHGIVMLQEIFGVNQAMQRKAELFADDGYTIVVPDLFWRLEPRVDLSYGPEGRQAGFGFMKRFDLQKGADDVVATGHWLGAQPGLRTVSVVGFCLGGKLAVMAGARGTFAAVGSFYGVQLDQNLADLNAIDVPLQIHVGDKDAHVPMDVVAKLQSHLANRSNAAVFVYPGAQHGFFNAVRDDVYDKDAASKAHRRAVDMLSKAGA